MKKLLLTLLSCFLFLNYSCNKDDLTGFTFTHDYAELTFQVNPTTLQGDLTLGTMEVETDIQSLMSENKMNIDNLNSVKVSAIKLTINDVNSTPYSFNLLSKIKAEIGSVNGTSMIQFAQKDPVPTGGLNSIDLDVAGTDLLPYFKLTKFKFNLSGFTNGPIDHAFEVKVLMKVKFEGQVIK